MAELADALDSGSSLCKEVQVQVLLPAPKLNGHQTVSVFALADNWLAEASQRRRRPSNVWRFAAQMTDCVRQDKLADLLANPVQFVLLPAPKTGRQLPTCFYLLFKVFHEGVTDPSELLVRNECSSRMAHLSLHSS